jgi:hypothetical protein
MIIEYESHNLAMFDGNSKCIAVDVRSKKIISLEVTDESIADSKELSN